MNPPKLQNFYASLPERFYERHSQGPSKFSEPKLLLFNERLSKNLGLLRADLKDSEWAQYLTAQKFFPGSQAVAQAYAGHQFGRFVPQLGDGRALLLGEIQDPSGAVWDLHLKGSGPTRFSRRGDGKAALGPMLREYILSEAMSALGVPTTRSIAVVATGEKIDRDTELPGAVLARVAASHIRVGSFEYFAARNDLEGLQILLNFAVDRHYPEIKGAKNLAHALLQKVVQAQAELVASWLSIGFIHGVMNTDNMTISGETIDYGPCAFMETYDPGTVFSSIDQHGRYAYAEQPMIAQWNLQVLGLALAPLLGEEAESVREIIRSEMEAFELHFKTAWLRKMSLKIGITTPSSISEALILNYLKILKEQSVDFTLGFRYLANLLVGDSKVLFSLFKDTQPVLLWENSWKKELEKQRIDHQVIEANMNFTNPIYIPRNHLVQKALQVAEKDLDLAPTMKLLEVLRTPFTRSDFANGFELPAREEERVLNTFCGT